MKLFGKESIEARPLSELDENRRAERFAAQDNMLNALEPQFPGMSLDSQVAMNQSMEKNPYGQQSTQPQEFVMDQMVGGRDEFVQAA